jgi:mannosyltransferase OCH1-like enzyme
VRIPRIFHQIWVGPDPFPDEFLPYQRSWLDHHPGWELKLWTDETIPDPSTLRRPEAADRLRAPWERGDIFRLEILWREGGVHIDTDFECLRSIEPLIDDVDFFIALAKKGRVNGAMMGSVPGHPALVRAMDEIQPRRAHGAALGAGEANDKEETGPKFLDRVLGHQEGIAYIESGAFFPRTLEQRRKAYAVHHRARSWKDAESLRPELAKFEQLVLEKQTEAHRWKERYVRATAALGTRAGA